MITTNTIDALKKRDDDMFDDAARQFFADMNLPADGKKQFVLANMFADYTLRGAVDEANVAVAVNRVMRLSENSEKSSNLILQ